MPRWATGAIYPYPMKIVVWLLWYIIGPMLIKFYGYGVMKKIGWGENLPRNVHSGVEVMVYQQNLLYGFPET